MLIYTTTVPLYCCTDVLLYYCFTFLPFYCTTALGYLCAHGEIREPREARRYVQANNKYVESKLIRVARALLCVATESRCSASWPKQPRGAEAAQQPRTPNDPWRCIPSVRACIKYITKSTRGGGLPCHIYVASSLPALKLIYPCGCVGAGVGAGGGSLGGVGGAWKWQQRRGSAAAAATHARDGGARRGAGRRRRGRLHVCFSCSPLFPALFVNVYFSRKPFVFQPFFDRIHPRFEGLNLAPTAVDGMRNRLRLGPTAEAPQAPPRGVYLASRRLRPA